MTKEDWENLSNEKQQEILEKCKKSPAYFYNNFVRKEGQREISDEEFLAMREQMFFKPRQSIFTLKTPDECFKP